MKFLPALALAMLCACHAYAAVVPVTVDPNLPPLYYEVDSEATAELLRRRPGPVEPPVATLAWASIYVGITDTGRTCEAACNAYEMASVQFGQEALCRNSMTSPFWYGSSLTLLPDEDAVCLGRDAVGAASTATVTEESAFFCGCCGTINRVNTPITEGCANVVQSSTTPALGGATCPPPANGGAWGASPANGIPALGGAPAICIQPVGAAPGTPQFGTQYPPVGVAQATCSTFDDPTTPGGNVFSRVCFNTRSYAPPLPSPKP